ncbi:FdtA/QdtA family cupin domain-containing protein [Halomonas sp. SCS19]|uniref:sugar 3,4-ketoisomerase n=1 Tax=Halomonas sp. SCS19 TaxID=2950870 RepID=UPI0032DF4CF4
MSLVKWVNFPVKGDERGSLVVLEASRSVPFQIKRVYYLFSTKEDVARGFHAHKELYQVAVCVAGKCRMLLDNGSEKQSVWLDSPHKGIMLEKLVWHEMYDFSEDCVLMVLADSYYDEEDYIRNYDSFLRVVKKNHDT